MNEPEQKVASMPRNDEIDLRELFRVLWAGKWLISGITFVAALTAVIVALMLPDIYRAEALLAPKDQQGASGLSGLANQYGGLASLAGIDLGNGSIDRAALGLEVLQSRKFISEFIERHDVLVPLFAAKGWDSESGLLDIDPHEYDVTTEKWTRNAKPPRKTIPTLQEAYEEFMEILSVSQDKDTGFITIAVEHCSPIIAQQWVGWLVEDLNASTVQQDVTEAEHAIQYLKKQIESTSLAGLQNVFFNLIEEQTKTVMLAKVTDEYLLKTLDPAVAPELRSKPRRTLIVIFSMLFGLCISVALVFFLVPVRKPKLA